MMWSWSCWIPYHPRSTIWSPPWRRAWFRSSCWISAPHVSCTRCPRERRRSLKEMMQSCCHANLEPSTITNGVPIPRGATIVVSWTTLLVIVETNARQMQTLQGRVMILYLSWEMKHLTLPTLHGSLIWGPRNTWHLISIFFYTYKPVSSCKVFMDDNSLVEVVGKASILVKICMKGRMRSIRMHNVLHVPKMHSNLLSVRKLILKGLKVHFN